MLIRGLREDQDVLEIDIEKLRHHVTQLINNQTLEHGWGVIEPKRHCDGSESLVIYTWTHPPL